MRRHLKNEEDYKREVLDLYSYINTICQLGNNINALLSNCEAALESLERIKVYRVSEMVSELDGV